MSPRKQGGRPGVRCFPWLGKEAPHRANTSTTADMGSCLSHRFMALLLQNLQESIKVREIVPHKHVLEFQQVLGHLLKTKQGVSENYSIVGGHKDLGAELCFHRRNLAVAFFICNGRWCTSFWQMLGRKSVKKYQTDVSEVWSNTSKGGCAVICSRALNKPTRPSPFICCSVFLMLGKKTNKL